MPGMLWCSATQNRRKPEPLGVPGQVDGGAQRVARAPAVRHGRQVEDRERNGAGVRRSGRRYPCPRLVRTSPGPASSGPAVSLLAKISLQSYLCIMATGDDQPVEAAEHGRTVTRLTDPRALRAYAHPVRMKLVGLLRTEGPLTATRAAELLGESSGTCSFHLRQLAKYGLVEEAGGGTGREKPWRATTTSTELGRDRGHARAGRRGQHAEHRHGGAVLRAVACAGWRPGRASRPSGRRRPCSATGSSTSPPTELAELGRGARAWSDAYFERLVKPELRPPGARQVSLPAPRLPERLQGAGRSLTMKSRLTARLLRDRVFRRYWSASTISMFGDQISGIALPLAAVLVLHAGAAADGVPDRAGVAAQPAVRAARRGLGGPARDGAGRR